MATEDARAPTVSTPKLSELFRSSQTFFYVAIFLVLCIVPLLWGWVVQKGPFNFSLFASAASKAWVLVVPVVAMLRAVQLALRDIHADLRGITARKWKKHVIVCGLGSCGMQLVQNSQKRNWKVIAIECEADSPHAAAGRREGIPVITGDAKNVSVLQIAGAANASTAVICTGDDAENLDIALRLEQLLADLQTTRASRLNVLVELRNDWLFNHFLDEMESFSGANVDLRFFNTYETASRLLLRELPLSVKGSDNAEALVIVGCGAMGSRLLVDAIRLDRPPSGNKARFIVFDREAEQRKQAFQSLYPAAEEFARIDFIETDFSTEAPEAWVAVDQVIATEPILAVAVCLAADNESLYAALGFLRRLERRGLASTPVYTRLARHSQLGRRVVGLKEQHGIPSQLRTFGSLEELFDPALILDAELDTLAREIHNYYRAHPLWPGQDLGAWEDLAETFRASSRCQADQLATKLAKAGLKMEREAAAKPIALMPEEVEALASFEHHRWYVERLLSGWRYAPVRNNVDRSHNLLVPWDALSAEAKESNVAQARTLPELLARLGWALRRFDRDALSIPHDAF
jgi:voltage-gated potassium channel Kch